MLDQYVLDRIEKLCIQKHWNYYELAKIAGLEKNTVNNWFNGSEPTIKSLKAVANQLGSTISQLLCNEELLAVDNKVRDFIINSYLPLSEKQKTLIKELIENMDCSKE